MNDPTRRRPGRPPLSAAGSTPVNVRLPVEVYDRLHAQASADRRTIPELLRRAARRCYPSPDDEDEDDV